MSEHKRPERQEARAVARRWEAAWTACCLSSSGLMLASGWLSKYLSPLVGLGTDTLRVIFSFLSLLWIVVMIFCGVRAREMRRVAQGQKLWREHKRDMEAESARAEAFLGIER